MQGDITDNNRLRLRFLCTCHHCPHIPLLHVVPLFCFLVLGATSCVGFSLCLFWWVGLFWWWLGSTFYRVTLLFPVALSTMLPQTEL